MAIRVPRIKIIEDQSAKEVERKYAEWVDARLSVLKKLEVVEEDNYIDLLRLPSETHLQWSQGMQKYILVILFNAHPDEEKKEEEAK